MELSWQPVSTDFVVSPDPIAGHTVEQVQWGLHSQGQLSGLSTLVKGERFRQRLLAQGRRRSRMDLSCTNADDKGVLFHLV